MSDLDFWSGGILHRLFKARLVNFNRAILRARLALASLYPCLGTCLLYRAYRLFPLVDPIKRFFLTLRRHKKRKRPQQSV
jgi:hypothetical protein